MMFRGTASGSCITTGTSDDLEVLQQREMNLIDSDRSVHSKTVRIWSSVIWSLHKTHTEFDSCFHVGSLVATLEWIQTVLMKKRPPTTLLLVLVGVTAPCLSGMAVWQVAKNLVAAALVSAKKSFLDTIAEKCSVHIFFGHREANQLNSHAALHFVEPIRRAVVSRGAKK